MNNILYHVLYVNICGQLWELPKIDGFRFHTVSNVSDAIDFLEESHVDVILTNASLTNDDETISDEFRQMTTRIKKVDRLVPILLLTNKNTTNLEALAYRLKLFSNVEYPLTEKQLTEHLNGAISWSSFSFERKTITLETKNNARIYFIHDIYTIERTGHRTIAIVTPDEKKKKVNSEEYYFRFALDTFPKEYHVERFFKKASQSVLVNPAHIIEVKKDTKELVFKNGYRVAVSANYIKDFL